MGRPPPGVAADHAVLASPYVLIAPPFHPLAGRRGIARAQLSRCSFLYREEGSGTRALFDYFLGDIPVTRASVGAELRSNGSIKQAVMAWLGVALISAHTVAAEIADRRLVTRDVAGLAIQRNWFVILRAARALSPIAKVFHAFAARRGADFLPVRSAPWTPPPAAAKRLRQGA
jgi:DNA-binding transcriptional LysR family regulator